MSVAPDRSPRSLGLAITMMVLGAVGWFASFSLLREYVATLQNPDYVPSCNISVLVSCGPNMGSWQGSIFGFSNPIIGVAAFTVPVIIGAALLAGARFKRWFWFGYQAGLLLGFIFVLWLSYQSIFDLHTLCPWCMVVWAAMIPLWWIGFFTPQATGLVPVDARVRSLFQGLLSWAWVFILLSYLLIASVAQFQLDWFSEFSRV